MKKAFCIILTVILAAAFALSFGCSGKQPEVPPSQYVPEAGSVDVADMAKRICENCKFDDTGIEASPNSEFVMCSVYGADAALIAGEEGAKKVAVYNSSASPEMIICLEAVDGNSAYQLTEGALKAMLEDYITNYTNYGPEEVTKLTSAVMEQRGTYVVLAVTADNAAAADYINELYKELSGGRTVN